MVRAFLLLLFLEHPFEAGVLVLAFRFFLGLQSAFDERVIGPFSAYFCFETH
jgi:hypothetical protein